MLRRLTTFTWLVSSLIFAGTAILYPVTYRHVLHFGLVSDEPLPAKARWGVGVGDGYIGVQITQPFPTPVATGTRTWPREIWLADLSATYPTQCGTWIRKGRSRVLGLQVGEACAYLQSPGPPWLCIGRMWQIEIPLWIILVISGVLPAWKTARRMQRRLRRHQTGRHCSKCGYDIRATPVRCPECGMELPCSSAALGLSEAI